MSEPLLRAGRSDPSEWLTRTPNLGADCGRFVGGAGGDEEKVSCASGEREREADTVDTGSDCVIASYSRKV